MSYLSKNNILSIKKICLMKTFFADFLDFFKNNFQLLSQNAFKNKVLMKSLFPQRFASSVEPMVFRHGSKETLHIQSPTWPRRVCQLGHGHRWCILQMCSRLHHSPQMQQRSQSQRGNWLLEVKYILTMYYQGPS